MQNRQFIMKMNKMDERYRKKLETLIWMVLFGKQNNGNNGFVIPAEATNMIKSLTESDGNEDNQQV